MDKLRCLHCIIPLVVSLLFLSVSTSSAQAAYQAPAELAEKLNKLSEQQRQFIVEGHAVNFIPNAQLEHEIKTRDHLSLARLVDDLMSVAAEMAYDKMRDMGAIPLNTKARTFNDNIVSPVILQKLNRQPGPFSVQRYLFPQSGIATFAGAPLAIYPQDLVAGDIDVAFIGIESDMGSGRRNAKFGPQHLRMSEWIGRLDNQTLIDPKQVLKLADYGDFGIDRMGNERSVAHIAMMTADTVKTGAIPFVIGGDTSILYPVVKGISQSLGGKPFGVIHFSAHPDVSLNEAQTLSDQQVISRLIKEQVIVGDHLIQIGLRGKHLTPTALSWMRENQIRYHTMAQIQDEPGRLMKKVNRDLKKGPDQWFLSVDVSALRPTDMSAAGRLESGGMSIELTTSLIRNICASQQIIGFELTDFSPLLDLSRRSLINASALVNACLTGIAVKQAGFEPDYVHPLARKHGE